MAAAEEGYDDLTDHFLLAHDDAAAVVDEPFGIGLEFFGMHGMTSKDGNIKVSIAKFGCVFNLFHHYLPDM